MRLTLNFFWKLYCTLISVLLIYITVFPQSENLRFENLTSENGLSQNSVIRIFQDSRGFLWFGTFDELDRYDGYNFKVYRPEISDSSSIKGQYFNSICEDKFGNLWISSLGGGLNKYIRNKDSFISYRHIPGKPGSLSSDNIMALFIDSRQNLWVGTADGLDKYDYKNDQFIHFRNNPKDSNSLSNNYILSLGEDAERNIWIGTRYGLNKFDPVKNKFRLYMSNPTDPNGLVVAWTNKIFLDKEMNLWLGTSEGLHEYDSKHDRFIRYLPQKNNSNSLSDKDVSDILEDNKGYLWVATLNGGVNRLDTETGIFTHYKNNPAERYSLSSNMVTSLFMDNSGLLWIGTDGGGIDKLDFRESQFNNFRHRFGDKSSLSNNKVYSLFEDNSGSIWIGTFGGGLNKFNPYNGKNNFIVYKHIAGNSNSLVDDRVRCVGGDKYGNIWIGTETGLDKLNIKKGKYEHYNMNTNPGLTTNSIFSILVSSTDEVWVGTYNGGVSLLNKDRRTFTNFSADSSDPTTISSNVIRKIYEDQKGNIWFCTDNGLDRFISKTKTFVRYFSSSRDTSILSNNNILNICQDKAGNFWLGTALGLYELTGDIYRPENTRAIRFTTKEGLPSNNIQSILLDNSNNLWISSNNGLSKFDIQKKSFRTYYTFDGLPSNTFYVNASLKIKENGKLIFGGDNGICLFNPGNIKDDLFQPPLVITNFSILNKSVNVGEKFNEEVILKKSIWDTRELTLSYKNNIFSLEFSALDFSSPQNNKYAYKMEGLNKEWIDTGNRNYASFTNLPPGKYILRLKAANPSGIWSNKEASLKITILPPYWETLWFRVLSLFLISLLIFVGYKTKVKNIEKRKNELERFIKEKSKLNNQLQNEIIEHKKTESELRKAKEDAEKSDRLKSEFLAQISHEIRTPINAILSFSSLIKDDVSKFLSEEMQEGFSIIQRAGRRLIRTVDLIINMSLLQTDSFELNLQHFDVFEKVLRKKIEEYSIAAKGKGLQFEVRKDVAEAVIYADESTIDQIFDNLINNAVKFTGNGIVGLHLFNDETNRLVAEIYDTGIGISDEYISQLFKPFSQEETGYKRKFEGNGLGLALAKKFADMNNITLKVHSKKGYGTKIFVIFNSERNIKAN